MPDGTGARGLAAKQHQRPLAEHQPQTCTPPPAAPPAAPVLARGQKKALAAHALTRAGAPRPLPRPRLSLPSLSLCRPAPRRACRKRSTSAAALSPSLAETPCCPLACCVVLPQSSTTPPRHGPQQRERSTALTRKSMRMRRALWPLWASRLLDPRASRPPPPQGAAWPAPSSEQKRSPTHR